MMSGLIEEVHSAREAPQRFQPRRNRDAWAAIRGYVYQVQLTIERWLHLDENQALDLERGEDIDVISGWVADGTGSEQRLLEQIKHIEGSITLNSLDAKTAIANFVEHRTHNPGMDLRFRLVTTASVGREGNKSTKLIEAWEAVRSGAAAGQGCLRTLAVIRSILRHGAKPQKLAPDTWDSYQQFLNTARGADLLSLILAFEWSTGQKEPDDLRVAIETALQDRGWAHGTAEAKLQYQALFADVFHRLSVNAVTRGHAELLVTAAFFLKQHDWRYSKEELDALLRGEYASSVERATMRRLQTTVPDETTQQLLFRVTLFKKSFTVDDVKAVAEVMPPVTSPRMRLAALVGLWLQCDRGNRFLVCPFVKTFDTELPRPTRQAVHDAMGLLLVRRPKIGLHELRDAIDHFVAAEEYNRAGTGLLLAIQAFHDNGIPEDAAGLTELWASAPLPQSMDLGMRIYLRILQAAVRKKADQPVQWMLEDLAILIEQVTDAHSHAFLSLIPHVTLLATHNFAQCSKYIRRAIDVQFSAIMPSGQPLMLPVGNAVEYSVWHQSACIKSEADLRDWMQTLRGLTHDQWSR